MRNTFRLFMQINALCYIVLAVIEAATQNYRCAMYAILCVFYIYLIIKDDIFIEKISNGIKIIIIKGDNK